MIGESLVGDSGRRTSAVASLVAVVSGSFVWLKDHPRLTGSPSGIGLDQATGLRVSESLDTLSDLS